MLTFGNKNASDNTNPFEQDFVINTSSKYKYLEIQVCTKWGNNKFPYEYIYIFERKLKYRQNTLFLTLNKTLTMGYIFDIKHLCEPYYLKNGEKLCQVPWNKTKFVLIGLLDKFDLEFTHF